MSERVGGRGMGAARGRSARTSWRGMAVVAASLLLWGAVPAPPDTPVADAAMRADAAAVRALLQQGADVNAAQGDGMTALHWAAEHGDADMGGMLLYAGARLEAVTRNGKYTPLHLASRSGSAGVVGLLVEAGADVHARTTSGGATPLHFTAAQGSAEGIGLLVAGGADVEAREVFGQTPLMWAAANDRRAAVQALIGHGAAIAAASAVVNIPEVQEELSARRQVRNRLVAALRAAQEPPEEEAAASGRGAGAAGSGPRQAAPRQERAASAPERGERADSGGAGGAEPPAGSAASMPDPIGTPIGLDVVPVVDSTSSIITTSLGYDELVGDKGGLTPLIFALREGHAESALALLDAGADINQVSEGDGTSPLLMATLNGHFDLAMTLLERGADVTLPSDAGATPLFAALNVQWAPKALYPQPVAYQQQRTTYLELMEALLEAGADPDARLYKHLWYMSYNFDLLRVNTTGATPFWRAAYATDVPAMRLLKRYGADHTLATVRTGGRDGGADAPAEEEDEDEEMDPSGLPPIPRGGPGVYPLHAASGVGYGEGYAANAHRHAPDGWLPAVRYLIEELGVDVNARDLNGYNAIHHAAARGDNELILYLVEQGGDLMAVSRRGQTTVDMANGPVQRVPPFLATVALLESLGAINNHNCRSC